MSYGISVLNGNGNLAITDQTTNFHYMGSANAYSTASGTDTGSNDQMLFAYYTITAPNQPIIFAEPSGSNAFRIQSVISSGTNTWRIMFSYTGSPPRIHAFSTINYTTPAETYGLAVYRSDNTLAFDSTRNPLGLYGGASLTLVKNSMTTVGSYSTLYYDSSTTITGTPTRAAYFCATVGHSDGWRVSGTSYMFYNSYYYRSGDTIGLVWVKASQYIHSVPQYLNTDLNPHAIYVMDAARYD